MTALLYYIGALLSWVVHPALWVTVWPLELVARLHGTVSQESGYSPTIAGDGGASVGLAQFKAATWEAFWPRSAPRTSAFWSGWKSSSYLSAAITSRPAFWWPELVGTGATAMRWTRHLWTHGLQTTRSLNAASGDTPRAMAAYQLVSAIRWAFWIILLLGVAYAARKRR